MTPSTLWLLVSILLLVVLDRFELEPLVALSVIGVLLMTEVTAPTHINPQWRQRLSMVRLLSILVFVVVASRRLVEIVVELI